MRLTQLRSFHAVATEKGFTRAARALHVSQPTITSQVRMLEETYNVQLFHRDGAGVRLTALGEQLFKISQQMFFLEADGRHLLHDAGELKNGELRIASVGPHHISRMLVDFNKRYPDIHVFATIDNSVEVVRQLLDYRADIGVLAQTLDDERFVSTPSGRYPIVIFCSSRHPFAGRRSIRLQELQGQRFILRESGSTTRKQMEQALAQAGVQVEVVMEIGSRELIRECVMQGLGISVVSEIEYAPDPRLHKVRVSDAQLHIDAHVICLRERKDARMVRAFIDTMHKPPRKAAARA